MNTTTLDTVQVPTALNQLIFGDRNSFVFIGSDSDSKKISAIQLAKFLHQLDKRGYAIANAHIMLNWTVATVKQFKEQFITMLKANTKQGMVLRKTFAAEEKLQDYTQQDWLIILAQYSITYSWSERYAQIFDQSAEAVLAHHVNSMSTKVFKQKGKTRVFTITDEQGLSTMLRNIVESPAVLRSQQLKTLEAAPAHYLAQACSNVNIKIRETLIKVMTLLSTQKLDKPLLKTASDVVRYVLASCVDEPFEGQITKTVLKKVKHRIPTRMRKALLNNMEAIAASHKDGVKFLTEDMLKYENYWHRLDRHLRFSKSKIMRTRFPNYTRAIDLLYTGDRSWTYNARIAAAKNRLDYDAAIRIMAERPGVLMRNIVEYLRMTEGKALPVKAIASGRKPANAFLNALMGKSTNNGDKIIKKDASVFFKSDDFARAISKQLNTKLAWQLIEQLKDHSLRSPVYAREVQGKYIEYNTPIPGINAELAKTVRQQLLKAIKKQLNERNKNLGKVYIDEDAKGYRLQYSGRQSTELSFAGEFLSPGSEVSLSDYLLGAQGKINDPLIRLGVMWRSRPEKKQSIDIDHNVKLSNGADVYYGSPVYKKGFKTLVTSSGDITSCGDHQSAFSVELIDVDPAGLLKAGIKGLYSSMINYSGRVPIGSLECYLFFTLIDRKQRVIGERTRVAIDLSKLDYAIQVDANNTDNSGSYIGLQIDLENNIIKTLCLPVKHKGRYSNVKVNRNLFNKTLANQPEHLTIDYALQKALAKHQLTENADEADVIISRRSLDTTSGHVNSDNQTTSDKLLLHPGRDAEKINRMLF